MSKERFQELMRQYLDDRIDQTQLAELQSLLDSGAYEAELEDLFDETYHVADQRFILSENRSKTILAALYKKMPASPHIAAVSRRMPNRWWAAAAAILVVLATFLIQRTNPASRKQGTPSLAGSHSNKAVLTLADGRQIALDSTSSGSVAQQNNVSIIKAGAGQLSYVRRNGETSASTQYNLLATPRGGQYQVVLPDGTRVWLNSASSLRYPTVFQGQDREVQLTGEAYFEVAKDNQHPFSVLASDLKVNVLGTAFDLMAYSDEEAIRTTLVNGSVRLFSGKTVQLLHPGEQAALSKDHFLISRPDLEDVLAWRSGEFRFTAQPIQTIMRQMARWYDVDIEYQGASPASLFNGNIKQGNDASQLLRILETTQTVHFKTEGRKITVIEGPGNQ